MNIVRGEITDRRHRSRDSPTSTRSSANGTNPGLEVSWQ